MPTLAEACPTCPKNRFINIHKSIFCELTGGEGDQLAVNDIDFVGDHDVDQLSADLSELNDGTTIRQAVLFGVSVESQLRMKEAVEKLDEKLGLIALGYGCEGQVNDSCRMHLESETVFDYYLSEYRKNIFGIEE
jgi:hypothetical protein